MNEVDGIKEMVREAMPLAKDMLDFLEKEREGKDVENYRKRYGVAAGIVYATSCKAEGLSIHDALSIIMVIYKGTVVIRRGDSDE